MVGYVISQYDITCVRPSVLFLALGSAGQYGGEDVEDQSQQESVGLPQCEEAHCLVEHSPQTVVGPVERVNCRRAQQEIQVDMSDLRRSREGYSFLSYQNTSCKTGYCVRIHCDHIL
jgi:hypothetical protein